VADVVLFAAIAPSIGQRLTCGAFPEGLFALSSVLKEKGMTVEVVSGATPDAGERLEDSLKDCRYFGVSAMTGPYLRMAIDVSKTVKKRHPHLPVIWGGVHATLLPEDTVRQEYVDVVVRGMGEESFPALIDRMDKGMPPDTVRGVTYKTGRKVMSNPGTPICDINKYPAFDYVSFLRYKDDIREIPYISSRGCPYGCTFCVASKLYDGEYFFYPAERVFEEVRRLSAMFECGNIAFWDDNFFVSEERAKKFCDLVLAGNVKIRWSAFCHCNLFLRYEDRTVGLMKEAGLQSISFGAESGSSRVLDSIGKKIIPSDITGCVKRAKKFAIDPDFSFMSGFPEETTQDLRETLRLFRRMLKINPDTSIRLFAFTPYPGIPIMEKYPSLRQYFPASIDGWADLTYQTYIPQWLCSGHKRMIYCLTWMSNFLSRRQMLRTKNRLLDVFLYLFHISALLRLRTGFLSFPLEWKLFKFFYSFHTRAPQKNMQAKIKIINGV